jgi:hypothetical protein
METARLTYSTTKLTVGFSLRGQHFFNVDAAALDGSGALSAEAAYERRTAIMTHIAIAIAAHATETGGRGDARGWKALDLKFVHAPPAFCVPTAIDVALDGIALVIVDFKAFMGGQEPACPNCGGADVGDSSWVSGARSAKGNGNVQTWFLMARKRCCRTYKKGKVDVALNNVHACALHVAFAYVQSFLQFCAINC